MKDRMKPFAKRALGQNFLIDHGVVRRIAAALEIQKGDPVVEIGAGRGALTRELLDQGAKVFAIEFDRDLVPILRDIFEDDENFTLIDGDALEIDLRSIASNAGAKLAANLPYNISTAILQRLMDVRLSYSVLVLMFQKEVVDRIVATPGDKERGFLSVLAERYFEIERLFDVSGSAFRPVPKVLSSVVRLRPKHALTGEDERFRRIVSLGFLQKRKTILNNLKGEFAAAREMLENAGIDPNRRAETLTAGEWEALAGETS